MIWYESDGFSEEDREAASKRTMEELRGSNDVTDKQRLVHWAQPKTCIEAFYDPKVPPLPATHALRLCRACQDPVFDEMECPKT